MEDIFLLLIFFFSQHNIAIQNQNPGCHIQTSSFADTHIPVLSRTLNAASQESNATSDALKLFVERNPAHSCSTASIPTSPAGDVQIRCAEGYICCTLPGKNLL